MTREEREKIYIKFILKHPRKSWWRFDYIDSLYSQFSWCLDQIDQGKGKEGFTLFMEHCAWCLKPNNRDKIDIIRTVNSFSEQGISISFKVNPLADMTLTNQWLSLSEAGQRILMKLQSCYARRSVTFTRF